MNRHRGSGADERAVDPTRVLSDRQREVVQLIAEGLTYAEIAGRLGISRHTVNAHMQAMFRKTGVTSSRRLLAFLNGHDVNE